MFEEQKLQQRQQPPPVRHKQPWAGSVLGLKLQELLVFSSRVGKLGGQVKSVVLLVEQQDPLDFDPHWIGFQRPGAQGI